MDSMFMDCNDLQSLDLSSFNTSKVTDMSAMFSFCSSLQSLDLSSFDTTMVKDIGRMFEGCMVLSTSITVSGSKWYEKNAYTDCFENAAVLDTTEIIIRYAGDCTKEMAEALAETGSTDSHISVENGLPISGTDGDLSWSIDENSKLTVNGVGDCETSDSPAWNDYASFIKEADINVSGTTSMAGWFNGCIELESIDFSDTDTSNVTTMRGLFCNCSNLQVLDVSGFDTSGITDFTSMFEGCSKLSNLNLSSFDTTNGQSFGRMFYNCSSLSGLNLSSFDTTNGQDFDSMFYNCSSLTDLDLSGFCTDHASGLSKMFYRCIALNTSFFVSGSLWYKDNSYSDCFLYAATVDNAEITIIYTGDCTKAMAEALAATGSPGSHISVDNILPVSGVDGDLSWSIDEEGKLTVTGNGDCCFEGYDEVYGCDSFDADWLYYKAEIKSADINVTGTTSMWKWFLDCTNLEYIDFSDTDTSNVTIMASMFSGCSSLKELDISSLDTSNAVNFSNMFSGCSSLTGIDLSGFDTSNAVNFSNMFSGCSSLTGIDLSSFNTSNAVNFSSMFSGCSSLTELDLSSFSTENALILDGMFSNCRLLSTNLTLSLKSQEELQQDSSFSYKDCFLKAATANHAKIIVEYSGTCTREVAEEIVNTKSESSHVYLSDELPNTPADFSVSTSGECNTISFKGSENVTGYEIYRASEEDGEYTLIATITDPMASSYEDHEKNETNTTYYRMLAYTVFENDDTLYSDYTEPAGIIGTSPEILTQPARQRVLVGYKFTFSVKAAGQGLTYLWQYSKDGGENWIDTTRTKDNYGTTATKGMNGRIFRCVITSANGTSITSGQALLMVCTAEDYEAYIDTDGNIYSAWEDIPCGTDYTYYYLDEEGKGTSAAESKPHSYIEKYYDRDGNEVDPDSDLPCGQYKKYSICQNCGDTKMLGAKTVQHMYRSADVYWIGEDGTEYHYYGSIPCCTPYTEVYVCKNCGVLSKSETYYIKKHYYSKSYVYVTEDGTRYENYDDVPCETYVDCIYVCTNCGNEYDSGIEYKNHSCSWTYYTQDGTEYTDQDSLPCGTYVTCKGTCEYCGEELEDGYYVEHEYMHRFSYATDYSTLLDGSELYDTEPYPCMTQELGTFICAKCGDKYMKITCDEHLFHTNVTLTGEDGTVYVNEKKIPCGTRYTKSADCAYCGEHMEESLVQEHSFEGVTTHNSYILTDENGVSYRAQYDNSIQEYCYDNLLMYPPCHILTAEGTCALCGETFSRTFETHEWLEQEDGTCVCVNCGLVKDDCDFYKNAAEIIAQPEATAVVVGEKFTFQVQASGEGLTYLWQYSTDNGKTWTDTTRTKDNYGTTAKTAMDGRLFRCLITDANGNTLTSDSALLTVKPLIEITSQPEAATVNVGDLYRFKVTAVSNTGSTLSYLWQYSKNKTTWTDTTRTINNYGTYATFGMDGRYFRCQITDADGNITYSDPALLRVQGEITITEQPADQTAAAGDKFIFQVTATGASLTYLWQYSTDGGTTWKDTTRTKNNYTTYAKTAMNGRMYRCVITDSSNISVTSEAGTLTVQ